MSQGDLFAGYQAEQIALPFGEYSNGTEENEDFYTEDEDEDEVSDFEETDEETGEDIEDGEAEEDEDEDEDEDDAGPLVFEIVETEE